MADDRALWVYKNNARGESLGLNSWGDWSRFFRGPKVQHWGGTWMSHHAPTLRILREEMREDDRILAWQSDRRHAVGLAEVARLDDEAGETELYLRKVERFIRPVPILDLRKSDKGLADIGAFRPGGGTLFRTSKREASILLQACWGWQPVA